MGQLLATKLADLSAAECALLAAYEAALRETGVSDERFHSSVKRRITPQAAGASQLGNQLWAARRFLSECGLVGWQALPLDDQLALLLRQRPKGVAAGTRAFVFWLGLTQRLPFPPALLEALESCPPGSLRWLEHGRRAWPALLQRLRATALKLGYQPCTADNVCYAVTLAVAYLGKPPEALSVDEIVSLSETLRQRRIALRAAKGLPPVLVPHQPLQPWTTGTVLYHAGLLSTPPGQHLIGRRPGLGIHERQLGFLRQDWPALYEVAERYLARRQTLVRLSTVKQDTIGLGSFLRWLTQHHPEVTDLRQLDRRQHIEPYLHWVLADAGPGRAREHPHWTTATCYQRIDALQRCFRLLSLWQWPEAPARPLLLPGDLPRLPEPLPKAFDDVQAARMLHLARTSSDPLERLIIELLASCGLRVGEARDLKLSDIVSFGGQGQAAQPWLHVPLGKLGNDRYVPIGPELQAALDAFLAAERSSREWDGLPSPPDWTAYVLARKGRRPSKVYCNQVVQRIAERAGVADAHAHRWRHTFATQAINRGMDLASIATLLGHKGLEMTMVYARIANPKLRQEFERVSHQVQAFYSSVGSESLEAEAPVVLPSGVLGPAMVATRREMEWRRLGNGWCTRRAYLDCRYELVCERCIHFNTDHLFLPVLEMQHADAIRKGQQARMEMFGKLIADLKRSEAEVVPLPLVEGSREADFSNPTQPTEEGGQR